MIETLSFLIAAVLSSPTVSVAFATAQDRACRITGGIVRLRDLPEASGVAASRRSKGVFWAHNDSGDPVLFALDAQGTVTGRVRVAGAAVEDWEDVAVGPCDRGTCVYIGDIGDNDGSRDHIRVYRAVEPAPQDSTTRSVEVFEAVYPDGPHDAEALFITADGDVFIITKGDPGAVALYRFPRPLQPGKRVRLDRVGAPVDATNVAAKDRPTAADLSPDGQWVAVRTTSAVTFYRTADLIAGVWKAAFRTDLTSLREPRGEGITFDGNADLVLLGEGGVLSRAGTFARMTCTFAQ